jgi:hypothetical protein
MEAQNSTGVVRVTSTAPIERAHSDRARSGSTEVILTTPSSLCFPRRRERPRLPTLPHFSFSCDGQGCHFSGVARWDSTARNILTRPTPSAPRRALVPGEHSFIVRILRARRMVWRLPIPPFRGRALREQENIPAPSASNHTVKCCFTISALNSLLFPDTTTAPLAITTYFSARRAAKWSPCSTNKMAKRR